MNIKSTISGVLLLFVFHFRIHAQDTMLVANDYKYKIGVKLISERTGDKKYEDKNFHVFCGGIQAIRKIKNTKSSVESGLYLNTKAWQFSATATNAYPPPTNFNFPLTLYYYYLSVPVNYRLDTKTIYFATGIVTDYLVYRRADENKSYVDSISNTGTDRKFLIGYNLNIGMEKSISYRMNLFVEARLAITVSSPQNDGGFIMDSGSVGTSNVNYGFAVGVNSKLRRKVE